MAIRQHSRTSPAYPLAVAASLVTAVLYAIVGFKVMPVVPFLIASAAFAELTALLLLRPGVAAYAGGVALSLAAIAAYVAFAPSRHPAYEAWGLSVSAVEALLTGLLVFLVIDRQEHGQRRPPRRRQFLHG